VTRLPCIDRIGALPGRQRTDVLLRDSQRKLTDRRSARHLALHRQNYSGCFSFPIHFSTVRASFQRRLRDARDDGAADGRQALLRRWSVDSFFPPRCLKATMLQESEGEHRHERVAVKTLPGSPLEVVEAEFLLYLLMRLVANPSCLYGGGKLVRIVFH
jgi:hypothetical protein